MGLDSSSDTPEPISVPGPQCDVPVPPIETTFAGIYGRWHATEGQWANVQASSLVHDLITGPGGDLKIADKWNLTHETNERCETAIDSTLRADQCSRKKEAHDAKEPLCKLPEPHHILMIGNEIEAKLYANHLAVKIGNGMVARPVVDKIRVNSRWFDPSGSETLTASVNPILEDRAYQPNFKVRHESLTGTCGYGLAENGMRKVEPVTSGFTAPTECPAGPQLRSHSSPPSEHTAPRASSNPPRSR